MKRILPKMDCCIALNVIRLVIRLSLILWRSISVNHSATYYTRNGFCAYELEGYTGFVFSNKLGTLHNPHCVNLAIKRIYETYNAKEIIDAKRQSRKPIIIPHSSCHSLRHTFCSRLCESDINIKVVQEIMGHKNVETTLDIYTEVNFNKKQESLEELASKMDFF